LINVHTLNRAADVFWAHSAVLSPAANRVIEYKGS
jgi:hypothetical protein